MSPLFVRGRHVLKILYDSGLAPKCNVPLLRTHPRSCRTMFTKSPKNQTWVSSYASNPQPPHRGPASTPELSSDLFEDYAQGGAQA